MEYKIINYFHVELDEKINLLMRISRKSKPLVETQGKRIDQQGKLINKLMQENESTVIKKK